MKSIMITIKKKKMKKYVFPFFSSILMVILFCNFKSEILLDADNNKNTILNQINDFDNPNNQKNALSEIYHFPQRYRVELLKYLKINRDMNDKKFWPTEPILYSIALTQDTIFFEPLISFLEYDDYISETCIYNCALIFSIVLTSHEDKINKISRFEKLSSSAVSDIYAVYNKYVNKIPMTSKEREDALSKSIDLVNSDDIKVFEDLKKLSIQELLQIGEDRKNPYLMRIMAVYIIEHRAESLDLIDDISFLLINAPDDASKEYVGACQRAILNILNLNREKSKEQ